MESKDQLGEARRAEFDALYTKHHREVWSVAYARWLDSDTALDVAQEAFMRLWKHWEAGLEEIQNPRAWLMRVARNLAEDYGKSAFRRNGTTPNNLMTGVTASTESPLEGMVKVETFGIIRQLMEELPQGDRDILTLRYALDYEAPQIAETLGIAPTAVHMRLSRARQRLAELLAAQGIEKRS